jgi:hypothetical protein
LPLGVLRYLVRALSQHLEADPLLDEGRWHGHRTFLVDGSSVSMPDTPELQAAFWSERQSKARLRLSGHALAGPVSCRQRLAPEPCRRSATDS